MSNKADRNKKIKLFFGEKDINYAQPNNYAFLNWMFDNSMGGKDNLAQSAQDNFVMGNAYMANAVLGLYSIIYNKNRCSTADTLIFSIMFDIWHGLELWLKSSIYAIDFLTDSDKKKKQNHGIDGYLNILKGELKRLGMNQTIDIALYEVTALIEEFQRVNANFDFARYSFDSKGNYQFYNTPSGDEQQWQNDGEKKQNGNEIKNEDWSSQMLIVPNTCVDLRQLFVALLGIVKNFRDFVEYLTLVITEGGYLTDDAYNQHLKICKESEESMRQMDNDEQDMGIEAIMKLIYLHIL